MTSDLIRGWTPVCVRKRVRTVIGLISFRKFKGRFVAYRNLIRPGTTGDTKPAYISPAFRKAQFATLRSTP
jgi:hypothetical protein